MSTTSPLAATQLIRCFDATSHSDSIAVIDSAGPSTFAETARRARHLAGQLSQRGLQGSRIALLAAPDRSWVEAFWAILLCGGTPVPLSPLHPVREQDFFLAHSAARAFLVGESLAATETQHPERLIFGGGRLFEGQPARLGDSPAQARPVDAEERSALILYTSGTTGQPKAVPLSHHNVFSGVRGLNEAWGVSPRDRLIHTLPLHHLHGICVSLLCAYCAGASTHLLPRYDVREVLEAASSASILMGVPTQHKRLVEHFEADPAAPEQAWQRSQLRQLRLITSGSAKLPEQLGQQLQALSGQYPLERYGMTEVGIVLSNPLLGERQPGSCGKPLPGAEIRVVDEAGQAVAPGQAGELWMRGPTVFRGYDGDATATAAAFEQGFFKSGDTATQSPDGYVRILGRSSVDIIKSGGYKLSAIEIEEQLRAHPAVHDVAVIGLPDDTWGERVVAVVIPSASARSAATRDPAQAGHELRQWLKGRMAVYRVPKSILWRDDLPRNALGKVQKKVLLAELGAPDARPDLSLADAEAKPNPATPSRGRSP